MSVAFMLAGLWPAEASTSRSRPIQQAARIGNSGIRDGQATPNLRAMPTVLGFRGDDPIEAGSTFGSLARRPPGDVQVYLQAV